MQPNGERNQQGPSGPPNFPPPGGGYAKPGPFSGPNQTRNLLMAAAAVIVLAVVVIASVAACSSSDSVTTGQQHNSGDGAVSVATTSAESASGATITTPSTQAKPSKLDASLIDGLTEVSDILQYARTAGIDRPKVNLGLGFSVASAQCVVGFPGSSTDTGLFCQTSAFPSDDNPYTVVGWIKQRVNAVPPLWPGAGANLSDKPQYFPSSRGSMFGSNRIPEGEKITFGIASDGVSGDRFTCGNKDGALVCVNEQTKHGFWLGVGATSFEVW